MSKNPALKTSNSSSTRFWDKAKMMVEVAARFRYPEPWYTLEPDFSRPVAVELSWFKRFQEKRQAMKRLKERYDLSGLEFTYNNLADEYSKEMFLYVLVYRLFKRSAVRFPIYYSKYPKQISEIASLRMDGQEFKQKFLYAGVFSLHKYDLSPIGYDVRLWCNPLGIVIDYLNEQYRYQNVVNACPGDYVIDGGACWGDTALYFAAKTKPAGKVFSFEFVPENLDIFKKNMDMNPQYNGTIELIEGALSDGSAASSYFVQNGPGSFLTDQPQEGGMEIPLMSIDEMMEKRQINKLDFIKLDVEKCELAVLKGAEKSLRKYKPKLAVCLYHQDEDLWTIPRYLKTLIPEYRLYLDHHTTSAWETVLYAVADKNL